MTFRLHRLGIVAILLGVCGTATATSQFYSGVVTLCTGTCASFASLDLGTTVFGEISVDVGPNSSFAFADVGVFSLSLFNPAAPPESFDPHDPTTANPLPINPSTAPIVPTGGGFVTGGTTDEKGSLATGYLLFEFMIPPLNTTEAWMIIDITNGQARICLFFETSGCIPNATEAVVLDGGPFEAYDENIDNDDVPEDVDNCTTIANPTQSDTDLDGIGNACDPDLNNDCIVNFADLSLFSQRFLSSDPDADFNDDNVVNFLDFQIATTFFLMEPGPGSVPNLCKPFVVATEDFGFPAPDDGGWSTGFGGSVVAGAGDGGGLNHAMMYTADRPSGANGFHHFHPVFGATPNSLFQSDYIARRITDITVKARHSGIGDPVVLRAVLFDDHGDGTDWAQTLATVTIPNTATSWQTYALSLRAVDLSPGGQNGKTVVDILSDVFQVGFRHDPLGTGPGIPSEVAAPTTVWFDDITLQNDGNP